MINRDILIYIRHLTGATIMSKPTVKSAIKSEPEEVTNLDRFVDLMTRRMIQEIHMMNLWCLVIQHRS